MSGVVQSLADRLSGVPEYGCVISPAKSLVNFDYQGESPVPRTGLAASSSSRDLFSASAEILFAAGFPYCGLTIDVATLDLEIDHERIASLGESRAGSLGSADVHVSDQGDTLTVKTYEHLGQAFLAWLKR